MPRRVEEALQAWRDAERRLAEATPGSPEEAQAAVDMRVLRTEYNRLVREREETGEKRRAPDGPRD